MKKILLETSFSKIYMIVMIIITLLILGGYFSYAMFTVTKEKENAISIVTGNLTYELLIEGEKGDTLTVPANSRKDFIVTLTNPNNRVGRFNFYYEGNLPEGVDIGYIEKEGVNTPPSSTGVNLEKVDTTGSSNTYIVRVANTTSSSVTINLGVSVGLDYNDLELPDNGHLLRKITSTGTVSEVIEDDIMNRLNYEDSEQTFVTGSNPYNYIWYSGKLWRVVSIDTSDNSVKLVTQWNISAISYDNDSSAFAGSYMEDWLNDTTVDGFLGNLRDYENFIVTDSEWYDQETDGTVRPIGTPTIDAVGLLNYYEATAGSGGNVVTGFLHNGLYWATLTRNDSTTIVNLNNGGVKETGHLYVAFSVRPSINLKPEIKIVDGDGTVDNPYRLMGDNDSNLEGVKLNTRYSGEYIRFGTGDNNLYRIVSHETEGLTKVVSYNALKKDGEYVTMFFNNDSYVDYSTNTTIGSFLNGEYLTSGNYLTEEQINMIEDNTTWYLGIVESRSSYKKAKYTDINMSSLTSKTANTTIGLLRFGELMAGQFHSTNSGKENWLITRFRNNANAYFIGNKGGLSAYENQWATYVGVKPSLNLKQNVIITGGDGTLQNPFTLALE